MNKYLKKVISAVAALAISASAVSAFAVNFPDVPEDASYAQAVQELSALKVISGFDDGTFRPDELVTRAQITKMIVDALAETNQAESSKAKSQFTDVNDHWAQGYINQGVADGFIAGYGDGTFGPDNNVTYVEAQKMLVSAIGYETYAQGAGGWPNGYKTYAASQGVTAGVSGINDDTQLTRAQVAKLVNNTMGAPLCVVNGYTTTWDGKKVPDLKVENTEGKGYQTLFTKKHNAYKVYGRVVDTAKNGSVDADKVTFQVEKAENFDDQWIGTAKNADEETIVEDMYYGDTNAVDTLLTYSQALIQKDDNDEFHIISIAPAASTKTVTVAAEDFDLNKTTSEAGGDLSNVSKLYFFPAGSSKNSQKYPIADSYVVYVNGVKNDTLTDDVEALVNYIAANDTLAVTLEKQTNQGSTNTSTDYNLINITAYETAIVKSVAAKNNEVVINFATKSSNIGKARITFDLEDEDKTYSVTYDGAAIELTDIQEDDVLSIAYDGSSDPSDSSFIDVIVSRDVVEDVRCSSYDDSEKEYTFGDETYKVAAGMTSKVVGLSGNESISATCKLYLDHFGRIAKAEEDSVSKKIAILKNIYKKAGGDYYAQVITKEGTEEEYKMDTDKAQAAQTEILGMALADPAGVVYDSTHTKKANYPNQVIEYTVSSSSNKITIKDTLNVTQVSGASTRGEYKASTNRIGNVKISDATVILNLCDIDTKDTFKVVSSLTDGADYEAYGYDVTKSGNTYHRFVIITEGDSAFNYDTQLAVVKRWKEVEDDDATKVAYDVVIEGGDATYTVDDDAVIIGYGSSKDVVAGDVILFTTSGDYITKIQRVMATSLTSYNALRSALVKDGAADTDLLTKTASDWTDFFTGKNADDVSIIWGVVANQKANNIVIAKPAAFTATTEDADGETVTVESIGINYEADDVEYNMANAKIYSYDFSASTSKGNSKVSADEGYVETAANVAAEYTDASGATWLDLEDDLVKNDIVFAIARVDQEEILEMYLIYAD